MLIRSSSLLPPHMPLPAIATMTTFTHKHDRSTSKQQPNKQRDTAETRAECLLNFLLWSWFVILGQQGTRHDDVPQPRNTNMAHLRLRRILHDSNRAFAIKIPHRQYASTQLPFLQNKSYIHTSSLEALVHFHSQLSQIPKYYSEKVRDGEHLVHNFYSPFL